MNGLLVFFAIFFGLTLSGSLLLMIQHLLKSKRGEAKPSIIAVLSEQIMNDGQKSAFMIHNKRYRGEGVSIFAEIVERSNIASNPEWKGLGETVRSFNY